MKNNIYEEMFRMMEDEILDKYDLELLVCEDCKTIEETKKSYIDSIVDEYAKEILFIDYLNSIGADLMEIAKNDYSTFQHIIDHLYGDEFSGSGFIKNYMYKIMDDDEVYSIAEKLGLEIA